MTTDPAKTCQTCGVTLTRRQYPSGRMESPREFTNRKFCSHLCASKALVLITHGRVSMFARGGCRCAECWAAVEARRAAVAAGDVVLKRHGRGAYVMGCRCETCREAHRIDDAKYNSKRAARQDRIRTASRSRATRSGYQWTGPEMEIASREDLSTAQMAEILHRSTDAVVAMRTRLRTEPKYQRVLGAQT